MVSAGAQRSVVEHVLHQVAKLVARSVGRGLGHGGARLLGAIAADEHTLYLIVGDIAVAVFFGLAAEQRQVVVILYVGIVAGAV